MNNERVADDIQYTRELTHMLIGLGVERDRECNIALGSVLMLSVYNKYEAVISYFRTVDGKDERERGEGIEWNIT